MFERLLYLVQESWEICKNNLNLGASGDDRHKVGLEAEAVIEGT